MPLVLLSGIRQRKHRHSLQISSDWIPSIRILIQEKVYAHCPDEEREVNRVRRGRSTGCETVKQLPGNLGGLWSSQIHVDIVDLEKADNESRKI